MNYTKSKFSAEEVCLIKFALRSYTPDTLFKSTKTLLIEKLDKPDYFIMMFTKSRSRIKKDSKVEILNKVEAQQKSLLDIMKVIKKEEN